MPAKQTPSAQSPADLRRVGLHPDFWHPVARSAELRAGSLLRVSFAGEPIALARSAAGRVFALEDRCAHRQVPLTAGELDGERVRCGYHGWSYAPDGRCLDVPYLDKDRERPHGVRSYPCREAHGLIFVFPGEAARAQDAEFPAVPAAADPEYKIRYLDRSIRCHYSFMHENLMDMNHQFLHRSLMGAIRARLLGVDTGPDFVEARYTFARTRGKQSWGERFMLGARESESGGERMVIRTRYPYQTLTVTRAGAAKPALDLWLSYVPTDREQKHNRSLGLMMIRKPGIPGLIHLLWPVIVRFTDGIFAQDQRIVELEQRSYDLQGADWNREVFPVILSLRALLARSGVPIA